MTVRMLFILLIALSALLPTTAPCQDRGFGAGVIIGEPTGFSLKGWINGKSAFDIGLAWSFVNETSFHIHADYLFHSFGVFNTTEKVPLYYGIGGRIKTAKSHDARIGVRGVVGVAYLFRDAPLDVFLEVAPIVDFAPSTEFQINAGFGMRYFFR